MIKQECFLESYFFLFDLFTDSIKLAYFTERDFDRTVQIIIKEDEKSRAYIHSQHKM